jgi:5-methylcytosine-specific restriction protein A
MKSCVWCGVKFEARGLKGFCSKACAGYARGGEYRQNRELALYRDGHQCVECKATECPLQCHHIKWVSRGGGHDLDNLQTLCVPCHRQKHSSRSRRAAYDRTETEIPEGGYLAA